MKNILLITVALFLMRCQSDKRIDSKSIDVLFIGNSFTYYHDMPQTLQKMLNETDSSIHIYQSTYPAASFESHFTQIIIDSSENNRTNRMKKEGELTPTEVKIEERKWDIVILQDGPVRFLIPEIRDVVEKKWIEEIKKRVNNDKCRFILFNTGAFSMNYPQKYCQRGIDASLDPEKEFCSPEIENIAQEHSLVDSACTILAKATNIEKSNNGNLFFQIYTERPDIVLLEKDGHPAELGSFLNACVFYELLTHKKAADLKYNDPHLFVEIMDYLKKIVK